MAVQTLADRLSAVLVDHLDQTPTVVGYPIPLYEMAGRRHYRVCDGTLDLDRMVADLIAAFGVVKELRCGQVVGVNDLIDKKKYFSDQHRYVTDWID